MVWLPFSGGMQVEFFALPHIAFTDDEQFIVGMHVDVPGVIFHAHVGNYKAPSVVGIVAFPHDQLYRCGLAFYTADAVLQRRCLSYRRDIASDTAKKPKLGATSPAWSPEIPNIEVRGSENLWFP